MKIYLVRVEYVVDCVHKTENEKTFAFRTEKDAEGMFEELVDTINFKGIFGESLETIREDGLFSAWSSEENYCVWHLDIEIIRTELQ